jgi:hypothetical protein
MRSSLFSTIISNLAISNPVEFISGNPGVAQFYESFAELVHSSLSSSSSTQQHQEGWNVHVVSYAGHQLDGRHEMESSCPSSQVDIYGRPNTFVNHTNTSIPTASSSSSSSSSPKMYGLREQVPHKLALLDWLAWHDREHMIGRQQALPHQKRGDGNSHEEGLAQPGELQFVLFGHSIGSWLCLQVRPLFVQHIQLGEFYRHA